MRVTPESGERSEGTGIPFPELARYLLVRKKDSKMINTRVDSELHRDIEVLASEYGVTPATFNRYILAWVALGWKHGFVDVDDLLSFTAEAALRLLDVEAAVNLLKEEEEK